MALSITHQHCGEWIYDICSHCSQLEFHLEIALKTDENKVVFDLIFARTFSL